MSFDAAFAPVGGAFNFSAQWLLAEAALDTLTETAALGPSKYVKTVTAEHKFVKMPPKAVGFLVEPPPPRVVPVVKYDASRWTAPPAVVSVNEIAVPEMVAASIPEAVPVIAAAAPAPMQAVAAPAEISASSVTQQFKDSGAALTAKTQPMSEPVAEAAPVQQIPAPEVIFEAKDTPAQAALAAFAATEVKKSDNTLRLKRKPEVIFEARDASAQAALEKHDAAQLMPVPAHVVFGLSVRSPTKDFVAEFQRAERELLARKTTEEPSVTRRPKTARQKSIAEYAAEAMREGPRASRPDFEAAAERLKRELRAALEATEQVSGSGPAAASAGAFGRTPEPAAVQPQRPARSSRAYGLQRRA